MVEKADLTVIAYEQNYTQFRALNSIMWQIPVLAMTLTGGLWFGVSKLPEDSSLAIILLLTAIVGNVALVFVLIRFRHVMGCYLKWLKLADEKSFVDVSKCEDDDWLTKRFGVHDKTVRTLFSGMLIWAALCSVIILCFYLKGTKLNMDDTINYYDKHAEALADGYESVSFEAAYPFLLDQLSGEPLKVLDVGSGTGRDAAWLVKHGHTVIAAEPSTAMRVLAQRIHPDAGVVWLDAGLPSLSAKELSGQKFDLILINAVWMHLTVEEAAMSLKRLNDLVNEDGSIVISLRIGPSDPNRNMYEISTVKFVEQATNENFEVSILGTFDDLLARPDVHWKVYQLKN